ncbi:MAG TPA: HEAT repeat domain-containing protein [Phycisphaerae bacterium]|nr:HEAT repeat domain-containing protein [Phycisphaerae bacterium]
MGSSRWSKGSPWVTGAVVAAVVCVASGVYISTSWGHAEVVGATPAERVASICELAHKQPRGAAAALAAAATGDGDTSVRRAALTCLGRLCDESVRPSVERCVADDDPLVRAAAAATLARYRDEAATLRLRQMAEEDPSEVIREAAAKALLAQGTALATVTLVELLDKSPRAELRLYVAKLLLKRYKINLDPAPAEPRQWKHLVQVVKTIEPVQLACRLSGRTIDSHPEDIIPMPVKHGEHCGPNCGHLPL